jgi:hypothetical protein
MKICFLIVLLAAHFPYFVCGNTLNGQAKDGEQTLEDPSTTDSILAKRDDRCGVGHGEESCDKGYCCSKQG